MRKLALVTISLIAVIALLDVAASWAINGSVNFPPILALVVALAGLSHLGAKADQAAETRDDVITLLRLRLRAAALARHTQVLDKLQLLDR